MNTRLLFVSVLVVLVPCWSEAKFEARRIVVPGMATADVAPDQLAVDFELETATDSFKEGTARVRAVATDLESLPPPAEGIEMSVSHELIFMRQKRSTRGTKQQHDFRLTVDGVPDGQAEEALIAIIQSALSRVEGLTVTGFEARLSDDRIRQVHRALLKEAVADARELAAIAAEEANLEARSVLSLRVGGPGAASRPHVLEESVAPRYYQNFVGPYKVRDTLVSTIRVSVNVTVEYECEPR